MITKRQINDLRLMVSEWLTLTVATLGGDQEAGDQAAVLTGVLIGYIPDLIDALEECQDYCRMPPTKEIERLQAKRPAERGHILKMDIKGGVS